MKKNKLILFLLLFTFSNFTLFAQKIEVKGKVLALSAIPVVNASVRAMGSDKSVITDKDGLFTYTCKAKDRLVITAAGFKKLIIKVKKKKTNLLIAKMRLFKSRAASNIAIEQGHIIQIEEFKELIKKGSRNKDYSKYASVLDILKNEFPTLQISNGEVIIRGKSSFNSSSAARFEVDGVITSQAMVESLSTFDIESIEIVKGSDAALYGVRGANGVISIKTKKKNTN